MHGHYARELLLSTLCSLPKNKVGDVCNSENYRGIALTSCVNKVLDWVILIRYGRNLKTCNLQFAYKEHHSTSMRTLALKEVIIPHGEAKCIVFYWTPQKHLIVSDLINCLKFSLNEMSQFVLFEFSLTCTPDKEFAPCGKAAFQKNF